jgi:putative endonuclease
MKGFIYIMANKYDSVLYTGVTSDLYARVKQHKQKKHPDSFSAKYNTDKLVYYEEFDTIGEAIKREKQIKGGSRKKKVDIINGVNPDWVDLSTLVDFE